jgi:hypothetical protein
VRARDNAMLHRVTKENEKKNENILCTKQASTSTSERDWMTKKKKYKIIIR